MAENRENYKPEWTPDGAGSEFASSVMPGIEGSGVQETAPRPFSRKQMSVEEYVNVLNVHLVGAFALTKALVPQMKELGRGRILFQASMTSYIGQPQVAGYSTAKAGYLGLIHTLTAELAEYGITVNAIAPGWIDTPMFHKATDNDAPRLAKIMGRIPAKTVGDPMDVGMCAAFLCSEAARYISGTCVPVDGGALIGF